MSVIAVFQDGPIAGQERAVLDEQHRYTVAVRPPMPIWPVEVLDVESMNVKHVEYTRRERLDGDRYAYREVTHG